MSDFNDAALGIYSVNYRDGANRPSQDIGILVCFKSTYVTQMFFPLIQSNGIYYRTRDAASDSWKVWYKFTGTAVG